MKIILTIFKRKEIIYILISLDKLKFKFSYGFFIIQLRSFKKLIFKPVKHNNFKYFFKKTHLFMFLLNYQWKMDYIVFKIFYLFLLWKNNY